jgi:hypothetical protein
MPILTYDMSVKRGSSKQQFESTQHLMKTVYFLGFPFLYFEIDKEEIPPWALIQLGSLGWTEWVSKFSDHL